MNTSTVDTDREIVISRDLNFPRELVWEAFTKPEHIVHWWGPNGFTNTIHEMAVKPGGIWRFIMHGPDGTDYPNIVTYTRLDKPNCIEYDHDGEGHKDEHFFHVVTTFDELPANRTKITLRLQFKTVEQCTKTKEFGAIEGGNQTLGRLADYLAKMA